MCDEAVVRNEIERDLPGWLGIRISFLNSRSKPLLQISGGRFLIATTRGTCIRKLLILDWRNVSTFNSIRGIDIDGGIKLCLR